MFYRLIQISRCSLLQDDSATVKRFKPSPVSLSGDDTSNGSLGSTGLKIRLSRYGGGGGGGGGGKTEGAPKQETVKRVSRSSRGGSRELSSSDTEGGAAATVKQESNKENAGVSVKMCEVRVSPLDRVKVEAEAEDTKVQLDTNLSEVKDSQSRRRPLLGPSSG